MSDKLTGVASYFLFNGTAIPITKATQKCERTLANVTDNGDYSSTTGIISPTQLPVSVRTELAIEGRYRFSSTPSALVALLYTGAFAIPVVLGLSTTAVAGHGTFDISDFQADVPIDDAVTFTCTMTSSGAFTPNS